MFRAITANVPKSGNETQITDSAEFRVAMKRGLEEWNIDDNILEEQVGGCQDMGSHELEEHHVNNELENQLENPQYRLSR